jgi:uncharacterized protein
MIPRRAQALISEAMEWSRVVIVNGPRQAGKSTLVELLADSAGNERITLDDAPRLRVARTDPRGLLESTTRPLFIDEVQRGGDPLVLAIKAAVDRSDQRPGQFVLTGSSRFLMIPTLSESLAGRAAFVDLWPLSQGELDSGSTNFVDLLFEPTQSIRALTPPRLSRPAAMERVVTGGFPTAVQLPTKARQSWFDAYVRTLIERELLSLSKVRQSADLVRLAKVLASRSGHEISMSSIAAAADAGRDSVESHTALFGHVYLHYLLPGWGGSSTAKARKRPKLHFVDSGLLCNVLGLTADRLSRPEVSESGHVFESFVVGEIARQATWAGLRTSLSHYRDAEKREVDLLIEAPDGRIAAIEVKAAVDVDDSDSRWLRYLRDRLGDRFVNGVVVHLGDRPLPWGDRITSIPVAGLWNGG